MKKKNLTLDPDFENKIKEIFRGASRSQKKFVSLLYKLAIHDEKTGLYNNKFFGDILNMEIEKAKRGNNLSLFVIDIDFFKKVNDTYGHIQADEFLIRLAKLLKKQFRKSDIVARFGGEEFFILLPETDLEKAKIITARLRDKIKADRILKKAGITVSGGLTQYREGDDSRSIKERADNTLYKAKRTGRDKFIAVK